MSLLNVAVWGLGNHAKNCILPVLFTKDDIRLTGVCSRNRRVVDECAEKWGCFGWHSPNEMLNHPEVDIVYIATPIGVHFKLAKMALEARKHVWCEKPLTCNYNHTKKLINLSSVDITKSLW